MKKEKSQNFIVNFFDRNKRNIFVALVIILLFSSGVLFSKYFKTRNTYTVVNGYVEKVSNTLAYILKNESIVESKNSILTIPTMEQGQRVSKNQIVAVYKTNKYSDYLAKMEDMDKEIQSLIKDLPQSYSTEISCIDIQIAKLAKDACKTTSYIKMQEYKNKIDELSNKKVIVLGSCSPAGSKIRELIDKRLKIESESKTSADNIRSNTAGIVTYKTDGLEQSININDITKYDISKFDSIIESYSQNKLNNYGIKIVDNYLAYILLKEPRGQNDKYINLGQKYTIKLTDKNSIILSATLVTKLQNEISNYVVFKLTNGIENIIDAREIPIEIIWTKKTGMAIPTSSIKKAQNSEYEYVTSVNGSQYLDIPIETILLSDSISIVTSMKKEKREELKIDNKNELELYDQLVINEEKK